ncbi:MAG TPA: hypothetical protein VK599_07220 [Streptosporangiaceae bacterium]|jgi:hypothetical protein|nr:hypothetical protein [Streptosporangiaceae bacterium]
MIRRGFWVAVGAAIGVSGYRRASRLARTVFPARPGSALVTGPAGRARPAVITGRGLLAAAASAGRGTAQGVAFARDVREGVAEYLDRQDQDGRTLDSQRDGQRARTHQVGAQPARAVCRGQRPGVAP